MENELEFCRTDLLETWHWVLASGSQELEKIKPEAKDCSSPVLWESLEKEGKHILRPYLI